MYREDINDFCIAGTIANNIYNKTRNPAGYSDNVCVPETEATRMAKTSAYNMTMISLARKNVRDCWSLSSHLSTYKTIGDDAYTFALSINLYLWKKTLWNDDMVTDFSEIWIYRRFVTLYQKFVLEKSTQNVMISLHNRYSILLDVCQGFFIVPQLSESQTVKSRFPIAFLISLLIRLQDNVKGRDINTIITQLSIVEKFSKSFGITFVFSITLYIFTV